MSVCIRNNNYRFSICIILLLAAMYLVLSCSTPGSGLDIIETISTTMISYRDINAVAGAEFIRAPTINTNEYTEDIVLSNFLIYRNDRPREVLTDVTIDSNSGVITIPSTMLADDGVGKSYTVTADISGHEQLQYVQAEFSLSVVASTPNTAILTETLAYAASTDSSYATVELSSTGAKTTLTQGDTNSIPAPTFATAIADAAKADSIQYSLIREASYSSGIVASGMKVGLDGVITASSKNGTEFSGVYIMLAEATGDFAGQQSAKIEIIIDGTDIEGTLSYLPISTDFTTAVVTAEGTWSGALSSQTVQYSISPVNVGFVHPTLASGVTIDKDTGIISVAANSRYSNAGKYAVTATGISSYDSEIISDVYIIDTNFQVTQGSLTYNDINATVGIATSESPRWDSQQGQNVIYTISPEVPEILIDTTTGTITVANTATTAQTGSYIVMAIIISQLSSQVISTTVTINIAP